MKKLIISIMVCILIVLSACASSGPEETPANEPVLPPVKASEAVEAEAKVVPVRWATLSFQVSGRIAAVNVQEGNEVKADDVLVQLDDTNVKLTIVQAEAALAQAEAQLAQAKAGPQPAQVAVAEQAVEEAKAALSGAEAQLRQLQAGARASEIAAAEAELARLADQEKELQENHDKLVRFILKHGMGGGPMEEQLRAALEAAKLATIAAQKRLDQLKAGPTRGELDAARADVLAAEARLARAEAQLELLKEGATLEQIAVAEAGVKQAQVEVEVAKAQLAKLQLVAPFDGVVVSLEAKPGELVAPGALIVRLADLSAWQIETDDLTELSVVNVHEGDPAIVALDAIPELELSAKVARIKALGENKRGDIVYTVIVRPDQHDERLRWNMTAFVAIEPR